MADTLTRERRSWNMSRIRAKNTAPELFVRSFLHKEGFRFRLHAANLPGKPDVVLPRYKTVLFIHGCFWHRHKSCKYAYTPKTRKKFWQKKFSNNVDRFKKVRKMLIRLGWKIIVIWECKASSIEALTRQLVVLNKKTGR